MATEHFLTYPIILLALDIWIFCYKEILGELSCTNIFLTCPVPSRGDSGGQGIFFKDFLLFFLIGFSKVVLVSTAISYI